MSDGDTDGEVQQALLDFTSEYPNTWQTYKRGKHVGPSVLKQPIT